MELWDEALYSSDEAMEFFNFFHKIMLKIVGKDVEIISYEEFKDLFIKFGKSIAKNYLAMKNYLMHLERMVSMLMN